MFCFNIKHMFSYQSILLSGILNAHGTNKSQLYSAHILMCIGSERVKKYDVPTQTLHSFLVSEKICT